ncbi:MAG: sodium:alanine symporter [Bacteroidetes bacterium]|nr:MAG: sodium:alanine symporter [Bacteroidota bacterium]
MSFESTIDFIYNMVWGEGIFSYFPILIVLILGAGFYFSIITRFLQVRHLKEMVRLLFKGKSSEKGVSSFQAFVIAISGRVGTGNIAGVATAIALGGPGAIFWMWIIAFLGSATAFIEATLGQIYKVVKDGEYRGGPSYYIEKGLNIKWYAVVFSIATIISMAFFLPGVQANSISKSMETAFNISDYELSFLFDLTLNINIVGVLLAIALALIIFGGVKRIGHVAQIVVPFMAIAYILMSLVIIALKIDQVPEVLSLIVKSAFGAEPAFGGIIGMAILLGVKRGIYSNEAGQGTAPHPAAAAEVSHPVKQGLVQAFSVYIDTLFICTATALMILFTGSYNVIDPDGVYLVESLAGVNYGPEYTQHAVESVFPGIGKGFVAISLLFFAFTTLMAYYYMAETNVSYLSTQRNHKWLINLLRIMTLITVYYATTITAGAVWTLGDIGVGIMAFLNIIAILFLQKPALKALKDYMQQKKEGKDPVFDPTKLGIKNADFWEKKIE